MRYAVFSDVHSNLEAFESVLDAARKSKIDQYIFLGDIVGYAADPAQCLATLRELDPLLVAGNHDWGAVGMTNIDYFNDAARTAILWTKGNLSDADQMFLSGLKLLAERDSFCIVHGTMSHPEEFDYMSDRYAADKTFCLMKRQICFVGHSHRPGIFIDNGEKTVYGQTELLELKDGYRYIVNDGSVGQPRDGDPRACFCIYDDSSFTVEFKRVEYDIALAQKKILAAGLPKSLADRLSVGR